MDFGGMVRLFVVLRKGDLTTAYSTVSVRNVPAALFDVHWTRRVQSTDASHVQTLSCRRTAFLKTFKDACAVRL
jgi:hypothetical protein